MEIMARINKAVNMLKLGYNQPNQIRREGGKADEGRTHLGAMVGHELYDFLQLVRHVPLFGRFKPFRPAVSRHKETTALGKTSHELSE